MMQTNEQSTIVAVFVGREQANQAIDNLRHAGFSYDQIRLVEQGANSFTESLKSLFTGRTTTTTDSADDWMRIGVPEQDAHHYQSELDAGRSIVLIKAVTSPEQALTILRQSGAYDLAFRFRSAPPAMPSGARNPNAQQEAYNPNAQPGAYNPKAQAGTYNPNAQPVAYNSNAQPETHNPNAQPGTYNPNAQPGTYEPTLPQPRQTSTSDERKA